MPPRKISQAQIEIFLKFVEDHPSIAIGNFSRDAQSLKISRQIWKTLTGQLNFVSDGLWKTPEQWRRYWIQFKAKTKAKYYKRKSSAPARLGKQLLPMSPLENRLLACISHPERRNIIFNIPVIEPRVASPERNEFDLAINEDREMFPTPRSNQIYWSPSPEPEPEPEPRQITPTHSIHEEIGAAGNVPLWMYDIQVRRLAAEERNAAALEAMVNVMHDIKDDIRDFMSRHPG